MRSTNMQKLNPEVRRRERVVRIFPNDASAGRLIGALLMEPHETRLERRCLEMGEFRAWADGEGCQRE